MIVSEAREYSRRALLKTNNSGQYADVHLDRAIQTVLDEFVFETKVAITSGTVFLGGTTAPGTRGTVDITTTLTSFRPESAIRFEMRKYSAPVWDPGVELEHVDYNAVQRIRLKGTVISTTRDPEKIAFRSPSEGFLDAASGTSWLDMRVTFYDQPTQWRPGSGSAGTVTINIPDRYLREPLWFGVASVLQHNDPQARFQSDSYAKYRDYTQRIKQFVTMDSGVLHKDETEYL